MGCIAMTAVGSLASARTRVAGRATSNLCMNRSTGRYGSGPTRVGAVVDGTTLKRLADRGRRRDRGPRGDRVGRGRAACTSPRNAGLALEPDSRGLQFALIPKPHGATEAADARAFTWITRGPSGTVADPSLVPSRKRQGARGRHRSGAAAGTLGSDPGGPGREPVGAQRTFAVRAAGQCTRASRFGGGLPEATNTYPTLALRSSRAAAGSDLPRTGSPDRRGRMGDHRRATRA